jgi:hypothetical protein
MWGRNLPGSLLTAHKLLYKDLIRGLGKVLPSREYVTVDL